MLRKFLFDLVAVQPNVDGTFHGGGKYGKKIFFELLQSYDSKLWRIICIYDSEKTLDNELKKWIEEFNCTLVDLKRTNLPIIVQEHNISRFYTALPFGLMKYGLQQVVELNSCEVYVTIHGLRSLETPLTLSSALPYTTGLKQVLVLIGKRVFKNKLFLRDKKRYLSLIKKTKVIAVSEHTKFSIMNNFPQLVDNIVVFYSPDVTQFGVDKFEKKNPVIEEEYFLLVSGNRWLKNNLKAAISLDEIFTARKELKHKVIITGIEQPEIFLKRIKNKERFIFYGYVEESLLRTLFRNAFALLYLSFNEGFGYPPLEAMKFGVPVIAAPFTSIPEIGGNAVLYSNPFSVMEIKTRILQLTDKQEYHRISLLSKERFAIINDRQKKDLNAMITSLLN